MLKRVRVGMVGAGRYAQIALLPALRARSDVEVVAVVDPDPVAREAARPLAPEAALCPDVEAFLHAGNASCAVVASAHHTHAPILTRLLEAGLDLFTEKPLSLDLAEAHRIVDLAARRGRLLMVGFNRRYAPACVAVKAAFAGAPVDYAGALKARAALLPRTLLFEGIHLLDLVRWYCGGRVQAVAASARSLDPSTEACVAATIGFDSGALATFGLTRRPGAWVERMEIHGGGVSALLDFPDRAVVSRDGQTTVHRPPAPDWAWARDSLADSGIHQAIAHFVDCVASRRAPLTCGEDALRTHELVDRIYRACGLPPLA
jgi:virulence factor